MTKQTAIIFMTVGFVCLAIAALFIYLLVKLSKNKKENKKSFFSGNPNSNFIMRFWGSISLYFIPFTAIIAGIIFIAISIQPLIA